MHYLVMPLGSAGDVHPFVGLALELRRRGHEVTLSTNGYFAPLAERFRLPFIEVSSTDHFFSGIQNPNLWHPFRSFPYLYKSMIEPTIRPQYEIVARESAKRETIVLANSLGLGAINAQDKLGVKVVSVHLQPIMMWSRIRPPRLPGLIGPGWLQDAMYRTAQRLVINPVACPGLNAIRAELGLTPVKQLMEWWHSRWRILCLYPKWFCPPQTDWPSPFYQVDFPLWDESENEDGSTLQSGLGDELETFLSQGSAPIAFTPGSANIFGNPFFETAIRACKTLGRRAILLTRFGDQIPTRLPSSVLHVPFAPLSQLLPRCAAFVHHGGIGSASQAMAAGVPQLIRPQAHDQFDNAMRIVEQGFGECLKPNRFSSRALASKLQKMLSSEQMARQCQNVASKIETRRGIEQAVDAIEKP